MKIPKIQIMATSLYLHMTSVNLYVFWISGYYIMQLKKKWAEEFESQPHSFLCIFE